jgi:membrane protein DedA with SNARE-associated domain
METLSGFFHALVVHFGYAGLFVVMTLGNVGMPTGTEVVMLTAGALAGSGHLPSALGIPGWLLVGLVGTLAEVCGGLILYSIGYYGGLPFVHRYGKYIRFREHELERVHAFYEKYGRATVFWCRFVPFVRGLAALPPGLSRMPKRYFITYTALGSAIFCFGVAYLGDVAGHNIDAITGYVHTSGLVILLGLIVAIAIGVAVWRARQRRARAANAANAATRSAL